jgi:hypothetical protein
VANNEGGGVGEGDGTMRANDEDGDGDELPGAGSSAYRHRFHSCTLPSNHVFITHCFKYYRLHFFSSSVGK